MGRRVERTRAGGVWSEARYFSFIRSALRGAARRYPVKYQVRDAAKRTKPKGKAGKHRFEFQCAKCKKWYPDKETAVDHITPAGSLKCFDDLPAFVERLYCEADGLQILCHPCHTVKTAKERQARKKK